MDTPRPIHTHTGHHLGLITHRAYLAAIFIIIIKTYSTEKRFMVYKLPPIHHHTPLLGPAFAVSSSPGQVPLASHLLRLTMH